MKARVLSCSHQLHVILVLWAAVIYVLDRKQSELGTGWGSYATVLVAIGMIAKFISLIERCFVAAIFFFSFVHRLCLNILSKCYSAWTSYQILEWCKFSNASHEAWWYENKHYKNLTCKNFRSGRFEWAILTRGSGDKAMALYQYFQPLDILPAPSGPLCASISPAVIKYANEAVRSATRNKPRGKYQVCTRAAGSDWRVCLTARQTIKQLFVIFQ